MIRGLAHGERREDDVRIVIVLAVAIFLLSAINAVADPGDTLWTRLYGGAGQDLAYSVEPTRDGGFIVAGCTGSYGNGGLDFYLVRLDANGDTLWTRAYGGVEDDVAASVQETSDGGFVVAGKTNSEGNGGSDVFLLKITSLGEESWRQTFGGNQDDSAKCVRETSDGGFIVCGSTESIGNGDSQIFVVKANVHGAAEWTHVSGGVIDDGAYSIVQANDGSFILAGWTGTGDGNHGIYIEKLTSTGETVWYRGYHPGMDNQAYSIIQTDDGNFVVAGYTFNNPDLLDFYLMKIGSTGGLVWERSYGGPRWELAHCVRETPDHGLVIAGSRWVSMFPDTTQFYLVRADQNGNMLWNGAYGFAHLDEGMGVAVTADGDFLLVGYSSLWEYISYEISLIMVRGDGTMPVANDRPAAPDEIILEPAYPNPFNTGTLIRYSLPEACQVRIEIFDLLGRTIDVLYSGNQAAGRHEVAWYSGGRPSGMYFCRLRAGGVERVAAMTAIK